MKKRIVLMGLLGRGGTLQYASHISSNLAEHVDTSLLLPTYSDTSLISKKVKLLKVQAPANAIGTLLETFNISQHIKAIREINKNADVIDVLDIHPWYMLYWPFLKAKKIVTINDPELHAGEAGQVRTIILRIITRFLMRHADEIVVLGQKQKDVVRRLGYKQKIIVSKIGNYEFFAKNTHKRFKTEPKTILFFGRIKDYKGLDYLLDALISLKNQNKEFRLIIAGEGSTSKYKSKIRQLGNSVELDNRFLPVEKTGEYFQRASFVVMPYTEATQTGVVQVTYSFKKPVIATKVGSLPELVVDGKTGYLVEAKNSKALAKAISVLLDDPHKAAKWGQQAYTWMRQNLDWKKIAQKLYNDLFS